MNPLPPNADELVSAYLDAEATPDEVVIVESSPELLARVESMRALSGQLNAPIVAPPQQKEAHIAAALGAFDALFGTSADPVAAEPDPLVTPTLAAVPAAPADPVQSATLPAEPTTSSTVSSFEAAQSRREARKPRRFNSGIIAAAAAAVLLFVGLTFVGLGRSGISEDVATSANDAIEAVDAAGSQAASSDDNEMSDSAEAMADDAVDDRAGGLSELDADSPVALAVPTAATPAPPAAAAEAPEPEPDSDAAMDDAGDTVVEQEESDSDTAAESADEDAFDVTKGFTTEELYRTDYFLGEFDTTDELQTVLQELTDDDVTLRLEQGNTLLFPRCQEIVAELAQSREPTLLGAARVNGLDVEIHQVLGVRDRETVYIVAAGSCDLIETFS